MDNSTSTEKTTIGNNVQVTFVNANVTADGKVDTGATTSSIHATNILTNNGQVTFNCPVLSDNVITVNLDGAQDVHSADGGKQSRPVVNFDIEINGIQIPGAAFNLNDRSNMDAMILVGQNILQAGNFVVDVSQDKDISTESVNILCNFDDNVVAAVKTLVEHKLSFEDFLLLARTVIICNKE